ncbi:MAG: TIGR00282 family metallophosphoesterase [Candidatus Tenebribacter burtonii]|jgi:metallophosphoesterase (TIGR00282 family)|nr:TIGR00282 family metallophosphoesterase [Candidatus Tenebribacter burtonii]
MNILFFGDIFGSPGRNLIKKYLPELRRKFKIDFCIANGENTAHGKGITEKTATELFNCGIDCFTSGNHIWDKKESIDYLKREPRILKPLNYHKDAIGATLYIANVGKSKLAVVNLIGQVYMNPIDSPFIALDNILPEIKEATNNIFVDFHAEATAEKRALAFYFDGRISAMVGTHTHIQTADEEILPNNTAYITDVGMTGPHDSCIGIDKDIVIKKMISSMPQQFKPAEGGLQINAVVIEIDENTGNAVKIQRIMRKY